MNGNVETVVRLATARERLAKADLCFDGDVSKFHTLLRNLEHALGSDSTTSQRLELLKMATKGYIKDRIESAVTRFEETVMRENLGRPADSQHQNRSAATRVHESPLKTGRRWIVPVTLDYEHALSDWGLLKKAILSSVLGQDGKHAAEAAIETCPPLSSMADVQRHAYDFGVLVDDYLDQDGDRGQPWWTRQYLRTLPTELVLAIPGELPQDFQTAKETTIRLARRLNDIADLANGANGARHRPTPRQGIAAVARMPHDSEVTPIIDRLRAAERNGFLARAALRVAGHKPCEQGLAAMTREDYAPLHRALSSTLPQCRTQEELVASIHQLLPKSWKRTSRHVTETTGEWDLDPSASKDDLAHSFALSRYVSSLKRPQPEDDDHSDEDAPPPPAKKGRKAKTGSISVFTTVDPSTESAWSSNFAVRDVLCALSDPRVRCHHCKEPHLVRVCPKLLKEDGSYHDFCAYCGKPGHLVGKLREPTCPVLQKTICPGCDNAGHTFDFCPRNVCASCDGQGHTSLVCKRRPAGKY